MGTLIDLSHPIVEHMTQYPNGQQPVTIDAIAGRFRVHTLHIGSHVGTHIDAPSHIIEGGKLIGDFEPERFRGKAVVSSVRRVGGEKITIADVLDGGPEPGPGDALLIRTGWDKYFGDQQAYLDHPSLSPELAEWAVERQVSLVGTDTISPDEPMKYHLNQEYKHPIHRTLLGHDVLIVENLCNLQAVTGVENNYYAFPIVTVAPGGDGGFVRFIVETA
jgi:kynurenine formamidase